MADEIDSQISDLISACKNGDEDEVESLIIAGIPPSAANHVDEEGNTPLSLAASAGYDVIVRLLLERGGAEVGLVASNGWQAIHFAARSGRYTSLEVLLEHGAAVNARLSTGHTPLYLTAECGRKEPMSSHSRPGQASSYTKCAQILLTYGADVTMTSRNDWTALHAVSRYGGDSTLTEQLIRAGADIDAQTSNKSTSLMFACQRGFGDVVCILLGNRADVTKSREDGCTAAILAAYSGTLVCLDLLISAGADVTARIPDGRTALHLACFYGNSPCVKSLIKAGADCGGKMHGGFLPLHVAAYNGHTDCVRHLLAASERRDLHVTTDTGDTPLHMACYYGNRSTTEVLLGEGAAVEVRNTEGMTALDEAVQQGHEGCVRALLQHGVPQDVCEAALRISRRGDNLEIKVLLEDYKVNPWKYETKDETMASSASGGTASGGARPKLPPPALKSEVTNTGVTETRGGEEKRKLKPLSLSTMSAFASTGKSSETFILSKGVHGLSDDKDYVIPVIDLPPDELEKQNKNPTPMVENTHNIEIARAFIKDLGLSDSYFNPKFDVCFCESCHSARGDNLKYKRGDPKKVYGMPIGWCKFGLSTKPQAEKDQIFKKYHVAFHGTRVRNLDNILNTGDILMPGDVTPEGDLLKIPKNHWDPNHDEETMRPPPGHDVNKFYFSPSIRYAGRNVYAPYWNWKNRKDGKIYHIKVAFQVRIKPGSYKIGDQTIGATWRLDPIFRNEELEWSTKRRGVAHLVGLMVKVESTMRDVDVKTMRQISESEEPLTQDTGEASHVPAIMTHDFWYKCLDGREIRLKTDDRCLLTIQTGDTCRIIHPGVEIPILLPSNYIKPRPDS